ncbi:coiled-coil domain-containing protein [Bdellovibrio svalbardensis]|uniref:Uncharacterized protein n=1 Tax=Bdellovibrio svalbardensis TaxID=2972972 RepID=A0ABT6DIY6_9BACT|nr:hypothetical protein [Bdellovibrio svalbardensis]MDG0815884.1 hypothetical protein [Bdellovibrio svalbardensis]
MKPPLEQTGQSSRSSHMGRSIRSQQGSAFIQALLAIGVVGIMIYFLAPTVIKNRQQVTKSASIITTRLALHSMLDFTLLGVKQRWCFSDSWMPENCGKSATPTTQEILNHPRSIERILMKKETVDFLAAMGYPNALQLLDNQKISATIPIGNFSTLHPIYKIVSDLKGYRVSAFSVEITRNTQALIPEYGREVYLKVTVKLLDDKGAVINVGSSRLEATSFVGVYPREVGSFALLVANDLHLDVSTNGSQTAGDSYIKKFTSKNAIKNYAGIVFDSPVYVNGNIILANASTSHDGDTSYAPVSFNEKVILGDGMIVRKGKEFTPVSAGGESDQFWYNIAEFGGFRKGVDVDGGRDGGLDNLSGKQASTAVDKTLMQQCIDRTLAMTDLRKTLNSTLRGAITKQSESKFDYRLGLTDGNVFTRQRNEISSPAANPSSGLAGYKYDYRNNEKAGPIAKYKLEFNGLEVKGSIPENGSITLEPKIDLTDLKRSISKQLSDAQEDRDRLTSDLSRLESQISDAERDVASAESSLEAEEAKTPQDKNRIADLAADLDRANNRLDALKARKANKDKELADAKAKMDDLQNRLVKVEADSKVQPKIKLSVDVPNPDNTNPTFKDFHVEFERGDLLVDGMGNPKDISIYLQAFDVSYDRSYPLRPEFLIKTNGYINFKRNGSAFIAYSSVSDSSGNSKGALPPGDINQDLEKLCATQGTSSSTAFGGVDWGTSFTGTSRNSWSFTNSFDERTDYTFNGTNASKANGTATFVVKSMAKNCIITGDADFVSGFLVCDKLIIKNRSTPLRIIGSVIAVNGLEIDDSAYQAGIRWSTIYHPQATFELRQAGILKAQNNTDCTQINRFPVWHPSPSIVDLSNLYRCNAISLRSKADPFRWTTVDPDCGAVPGVSSHMCKNRMVRFFVLEVSRDSGI